MELSEFLTEEDINLNIRARNKLAALSKIASHLARRTGVDERIVQQGLIDRERVESTGMGLGVAVPHALLEHLPHPKASLTRLLHPSRTALQRRRRLAEAKVPPERPSDGRSK